MKIIELIEKTSMDNMDFASENVMLFLKFFLNMLHLGNSFRKY